MEPEQPVQLEHILRHMAVGVTILDCPDLRVRYINPYFQSLLDQVEQPRRFREALGHCLQEILPDATLVGGTAVAIFAQHRLSRDADHVLPDLRVRFDDVLAQLEAVAGWRPGGIQP